MKKRFLLSVVLLLLAPAMFAQAPAAETQLDPALLNKLQLNENQLNLIPEPKEVRLQQGGFRVRPTTRILVEFGHQEEDRIAAETLAEEIHDQAGLKISITGTKASVKREGRAIVLARLQDRPVREFLESKGLKAD